MPSPEFTRAISPAAKPVADSPFFYPLLQKLLNESGYFLQIQTADGHAS